MVEFHLERVAPVLDLKVIPMNSGHDAETEDGIANYYAPQGRAGNDAGARTRPAACQQPPSRNCIPSRLTAMPRSRPNRS